MFATTGNESQSFIESTMADQDNEMQFFGGGAGASTPAGSLGGNMDKTSLPIAVEMAPPTAGGAGAGVPGVVEEEQQDNAVVALFKNSSHPVTSLFHVLFKTGALLIYLFGGVIGLSFVNMFIVVVLLLAFDFWTVKNVTGRLMVGLRWWWEETEDGTNMTRYESNENPGSVSRSDYVIFWYSMYLAQLCWILFGLKGLLSFDVGDLLMVGVGLVLTGSNILGYWRCSKEQQQRLQAGLQQGATQLLSSGISSGFFSRLFSGGAAAPASATGAYTPVSTV